MIFRTPITDEQKKRLDERGKPTEAEIRRAEDELFLNIMQRLEVLEAPKVRKTKS